jgi:hypothetical protein
VNERYQCQVGKRDCIGASNSGDNDSPHLRGSHGIAFLGYTRRRTIGEQNFRLVPSLGHPFAHIPKKKLFSAHTGRCSSLT